MKIKDKIDLLHIARSAVSKFLGTDTKHIAQPTGLLCQASGAFVTLKNGQKLRGCIGRITSSDPLWKTVKNMAIAASTDSRFAPVRKDELKNITIEISVLTIPKRIQSPEEIILGKHGIIIEQGMHRGTLLPQVAKEQNWSVEEFLGYCSRDKAGLSWDGWKFAEIFTYEAIVFSEKELLD